MRRATATKSDQGASSQFLSTLSLRRATGIIDILNNVINYFYPRSPCGERPPLASRTKTILTISIHALLAESDARRESRQQPAGISIHALLAESDFTRYLISARYTNFYPRSPCGERPPRLAWLVACNDFYPRSPCGERRPEYFLT